MTRPPVTAGALIASVVFAVAAPWPAAIVNKQLSERGRGTFATPAALVDELFDGSARVQTGVAALVALVLLGALLATVLGIWQTLRGERGGFELLSSGVFGVIVLLAGITVVM